MAAAGLASAGGNVPIAPALTVPVWWLLWVWLHLHALHGILGFTYSDEVFYERESKGMLSDGHIQRRISEHQQLVRSSRSSSRYSSRRSSRLTSRAGSPLDSDDESSEYQVALTGGDANDPSYGLDDSDSMDNSLLSAVIEKLNVISARRAAVNDQMEAKKQQWSREGKKLPSGSVQNETMFEKKLLGRVSSRHHSEAYLSNTSVAAARGGLVPQQSSIFEEGGPSSMGMRSGRRSVDGGEVSTDLDSDEEESSTFTGSSHEYDMERVYAGQPSSSSEEESSRGLAHYL